MKLYFHTGSNLSISTEEIKGFFYKKNIIKISQDMICVEDTLPDEDIISLQRRLGGTIKISKFLGDFSKNEVSEEIISEIIKARELKEGKLRIGVNIFSKDIMLSKIMKGAKKLVKSIRFVNNNFKNIDSVVTRKQILNKGGIEMTIFENREKNCFTLLKTISVQDVDAYGLRDYDKPARSAKVGMLPPKLAQILINLAGADNQSIWDPFVGTGTILMEGFLMGVRELYGSDISEDMLNASKINTNWLFEDYKELGFEDFFNSNKDLKSDIFMHDASEKNKIEVNSVVSEGYLGIALEDFAGQNFVDTNDATLARIWAGALENFYENGVKKVVFCLPCYPDKMGKRFFCEKTLEIIKECKYNLSAQNLIYGRRGQFVHRQIIILEI